MLNIFKTIKNIFNDLSLKTNFAPVLKWTWENPPRPHAFTSVSLQSGPKRSSRTVWRSENHRYSRPYIEYVDTDRPVERAGRYIHWRKDINTMSLAERRMHVEQDLSFYQDMLKTHPNSIYFSRHADAARNELDILRLGPVQLPVPVQEPVPVQRGIQPAPVQEPVPVPRRTQPARHPSGWTPINWDPYKNIFFIITSPLTIPSFVRVMVIKLIPLFSVIIGLVSCLIIINIPFIPDIYNWLTSILGEYIASIVGVLFLVINFLISLLLMVRRVHKSIGKYDNLFEYISVHRSSIVMYFFIILLSVGLVYACGDFVVLD